MPETTERTLIANFLKSELAKQVELPYREILERCAIGKSYGELAAEFDLDVHGVNEAIFLAVRFI